MPTGLFQDQFIKISNLKRTIEKYEIAMISFKSFSPGLAKVVIKKEVPSIFYST
jgi:hypothetical protein